MFTYFYICSNIYVELYTIIQQRYMFIDFKYFPEYVKRKLEKAFHFHCYKQKLSKLICSVFMYLFGCYIY